MSDCCESMRPQIIGRAFSLILTANESPVQEGGLPVANPSAWGVALNLVSVSGAAITITGSWVSTGQLVGGLPVYSMKFEQADTSAWPRGERVLRLIYTAPDGRSFEDKTSMVLEIEK